jgi:hypothetical protein
MSTIGAEALTLTDWAKRQDPASGVADIVELLSQTNEVLADMLWIEGNLPTGHRTTLRTGLPTVYWRLLNQGVKTSKSTTAQADIACGMLEARSNVDKDLAELNGNVSSFRLSEATAFVESMNQEFCSTLFYGNSGTSPEEMNGLSVQYSDKTATNGSNIIDAGSTDTDNCSIWLIVWGAQTIHGIFPKGSKAGLTHEDLGLDDVADSDGNLFRAYKDWWQWKPGIAVKDWRYGVRIGSIDVSNLVAKSSAADLVEYMIKAIHRVPALRLGRAAFYMNRTCYEMLDIQRRDDVISGGGLVYKDVDGQEVGTFRNIPVRKVDALLENETAI